MHKFTPTDVGVFLLKICKMNNFSILYNFASIDAIALSIKLLLVLILTQYWNYFFANL